MTAVNARPTDARPIDGRVVRGSRNREAIVEALLACYEDGTLRPSAAEIAERAGVSVRSVHNHFADVEALRAEVAQRQWERVATMAESPTVEGDLRSRIRTLVERRAMLFDTVTPVRRAALLSVHESPTIAANLGRLDRRLRHELEHVFAAEIATRSPSSSTRSMPRPRGTRGTVCVPRRDVPQRVLAGSSVPC